MLFYVDERIWWWDKVNLSFMIWNKCVTNCYNCNDRFSDSSFIEYNKFKEVFKFIKEKCSKKFYIIFSHTDTIFHPEIEKFILDKNLLLFEKSLHLEPLYNLNRINKIKYISYKYPNISFNAPYTIKNLIDFKNNIKFIHFLVNYNIKSTIDLFIDFNLYFKIYDNLLRYKYKFNIKIKKSSSFLSHDNCVLYELWNVVIVLYHLLEEKIIDWKIEKLWNNDCITRKSFNIYDGKIYVWWEIQFNYDGIIKTHMNAYCSKWIKSISSIHNNDNNIISDFNKLDLYLKEKDNSNMSINCFNCISNPYKHNSL